MNVLNLQNIETIKFLDILNDDSMNIVYDVDLEGGNGYQFWSAFCNSKEAPITNSCTYKCNIKLN